MDETSYLAVLESEIARFEELVSRDGNDIDRAALSIYQKQHKAYRRGVADTEARHSALVEAAGRVCATWRADEFMPWSVMYPLQAALDATPAGVPPRHAERDRHAHDLARAVVAFDDAGALDALGTAMDVLDALVPLARAVLGDGEE